MNVEPKNLFITECPREALQGEQKTITTAQKIDYINALLTVGYDALDCASFVTSKYIPKMEDTSAILKHIDSTISETKICILVDDIVGANHALAYKIIDRINYHFSISEQFQQKITHKTQEQVFLEIATTHHQAKDLGKEIQIQLSKAFGTPNEENSSLEKVDFWTERFSDLGIQNIQLSDTLGVATSETIAFVLSQLLPKYREINFGIHFLTRKEDAYTKLSAAYKQGCHSFNSVIKGLKNDLLIKDYAIENLSTEQLINFAMAEKLDFQLNLLNFESAYNEAKRVFKF